jgi:hypothetical protein
MSARTTFTRRMNPAMDAVLILGPTDANIMANGKITKNMEEGIKCGRMALRLKENGRPPSSMEEEDILGQVEVHMKECG